MGIRNGEILIFLVFSFFISFHSCAEGSSAFQILYFPPFPTFPSHFFSPLRTMKPYQTIGYSGCFNKINKITKDRFSHQEKMIIEKENFIIKSTKSTERDKMDKKKDYLNYSNNNDKDDDTRSLLNLLYTFEGHYDNVLQVEKQKEEARKAKNIMIENKEEAKIDIDELNNPPNLHEHLHCHIRRLEVSEQNRKIMNLGPEELKKGKENIFIAATYYFNNNPNLIFRCRVYHLVSPLDDKENQKKQEQQNTKYIGEMRIFRFHPPVEEFLKNQNYNLTILSDQKEGNSLLSNLVQMGEENKNTEGETYNNFFSKGLGEWLTGCEICWYEKTNGNFSFDGISRTNRIIDNSVSRWYHGAMKFGKCRIASQIRQKVKSTLKEKPETNKETEREMETEADTETPNQKPFHITIYDDLSLWSGGILIEDRGEDDFGNLIYGHPDGGPYIMLRQ